MNKKWLIAIPIVAVLIIGSILFVTQQNNRPKKPVEAFEQAVKENKPNLLKEWVIADDKKAKVNDASLKALVTYLKANNHSYQLIKESLEKQIANKEYMVTNEQISLVEDEEKKGIFKNYKLKVKTAHIKLVGHSSSDKVNLIINKSNESLKRNKEGDLFGPVLPGTYNIKLNMENKLGLFLEKRKVEVWGGSKQISLIMDSEKLVQNDKATQKDILKAVDTFNKDLVTLQTNGFNKKALTNVTERVTENVFLVEKDFNSVKDYIDEIQVQYLGATVNMDHLDVKQIYDDWSANVEAIVSYDTKIKVRDLDNYEDKSSILCIYELKYDTAGKKWLIDGIKEKEIKGNEKDKWKNKVELNDKEEPVMKWKRDENSDTL
ncbi:TcaA second domain-containing protein [Metabacillus fastidiosus]|uniref:TcaA second domain-containing protein n=1 Tax=Metabacillus fastidiosus TaxID=1458 RepID=UPI002DB76ED2|nr:hypothetical protein [Metabacillus fastidiosus]MEC2075689.1 hypothetical protein [Metabacillus fastidiosus]